MNFEDQLKELSKKCFEIESQLPMFEVFDENDDKQEFRRSLYRLRLVIDNKSEIAKKIDAKIIDDEDQKYFDRYEWDDDFCPECFS